jgi:phosphoribosyl 1,2-cyclic phosphodiesterase
VNEAVLTYQSLVSGSSGNLALVTSRRATIVLDLGIPVRRTLLQRLADAGVGPGTVKAALITHEHSDHLGWWGLRWCVEGRVPVLAGRSALLLASKLHKAKAGSEVPAGLLQEVRAGATYLVEDIEVTPFDLPHDVPTFGYVLRAGRGGDRRTLVVATDLGCARPELLPWFVDADAVVLEANYDEEMLRHSPRHYADRVRVASDRGHLSNVQSGRFLGEVADASRVLPRTVLLAHLSRDHNRPELATATVQAESGPVGQRVPLHTAPALEPGPVIVL